MDDLAAVIPARLVMLTLIALGLVLGWVARIWVRRIARAVGFNRYMERWGVAAALQRSGILRTPPDALACHRSSRGCSSWWPGGSSPTS